MIWALYGLFHSLFRASFTETNRVFKADSWHLSFWHAAFAVMLLSPLMPMMSWDMSGRFYFAAFIIGLIFTVSTLIQLNLSSQKSGRISSIYVPLEASSSFFIWLLITPSAYYLHTVALVPTAVIIVAFLIATLALFKLRPNDLNLKTFSVVVPIGVTFAVAGVVTKLIIPVYDILPAVLTFVYINYVVMMVVVGGAFALKGNVGKALPTGNLLKASAVTGAFAAAAQVSFVASVAYAPNPGYTSMMAMLLPIWLLIYHKARGADDQSSIFGALLVIASILAIVFAVGQV